VHIIELTYGAVLILIAAEFGITRTIQGLLATMLGFTFGLSALPFGFLARRIDEKRLLVVCCLGMGFSAIAIGLAPNIYFLGAALLVLGLSLGIYHPIGTTYISRVVSRRSVGFGYQGVGGNIGVALGPIIAASIAAWLNWRGAYLIFAIPPLVLAVLLHFSDRNHSSLPGQEVVKAGGSAKTPGASLTKPLILPLVLLFSAQVMIAFIYRGMVTFLPSYLGERISFNILNMDSVQIAGSFTTFVLIFGVGGQFLGGYLSERIRREKLGIIVNILAIPLLLIIGNSHGVLLIAAAAIFAFFHFMTQPIYNSLVADYSSESRRSIIFGLYFFVNFSFGSFAATILGSVADSFGLNWVFIVSAGFGLLGIAMMTALLLRRLRAAPGQAT
jgi:MFS family permease